MKTAIRHKMDFLLAAGWRTSDVRGCLRREDRAGIISFIQQRHTERFFQPIDFLRAMTPNEQGYGFAMMARSSLLIETIQSYRDGLPTTYRRELHRLRQLKRVPAAYQLPADLQVSGKETFVRFLRYFRNEFDGMSCAKFYHNVRNGLLHQGQTKGGWTIRTRRSALYDARVLDRNIFASRLRTAFDRYLRELEASVDWNGSLWLNTRRKIWWLARLSV